MKCIVVTVVLILHTSVFVPLVYSISRGNTNRFDFGGKKKLGTQRNASEEVVEGKSNSTNSNKKVGNGGNIPFDPRNPPKKSKQLETEIEAGSVADIFAPNEHFAINDYYNQLGRRFVPQYPYYEKEESKDKYESDDIKLLPVKASPEFVLAVAKQSKLLEESKVGNPTNDVIAKESLRTGEYWNDVWKEEVNPNILRSGDSVPQEKNAGSLPRLGSVITKIMPGTKLYDLISVLKRVSPKFLYVMNVN
ncbi:uncharacterized protein LOC128681175 isoform X2 [Plodia interpunctella]|uniref:uncharacterized protein LOC128681175 isoform X2 n=1 Tax=Plodia interpunctella TaxID=58824 RepID=UPI002367F4D3|nr:uncharacterized protein LOC128681175 isoform X2 [Plodia interpunctella]